MILAAFFLNIAGALFFAYGAFMMASEALQGFQGGDIAAGLILLPFIALFGFLAVACGVFALHGEDA